MHKDRSLNPSVHPDFGVAVSPVATPAFANNSFTDYRNVHQAAALRLTSNGATIHPPLQQPSRSNASRLPLFQWFNNLSVRKKQSIGFIAIEILSVIGLVGVSSLLIVSTGRSQLMEQARSGLLTTQRFYESSINEMSSAFRVLATNDLIIDVAMSYTDEESVSDKQRGALRELLKRQVKDRGIQYATLVGRDGTIIASANANRVGEAFDPAGLVSRTISNPQPISASAVASWDELQQEDPPLPEGFTGRDTVVSYTATPVFNPDGSGEELIGILISGSIVNRAPSIMQSAVETLGSGYGAIYFKKPDGSWQLAVSAEADPEQQQIQVNSNIYDGALLDRAMQTAGETVTGRIQSSRQEGGVVRYTMAAQTIPDANGIPTAVLLRGESEHALNQLLRNSLLLQFLIASGALAIATLSAQLLGVSIVNPLKRLQQTTEAFATGNRQARADINSQDEIGQVAQAFNQLADAIGRSEASLKQQSEQQRQAASRAQLLADLTGQMRGHVNPEDILRLVVQEVRPVLEADRVLVFAFDPDWQGTVVAESVTAEWPVTLGMEIADPCFAERYAELYLQGRVQTIANIDETDLSDCLLEQLTPFQVQASLVVPIVVGRRLWGLLITHQCSGPRDWQDVDVSFLTQIGLQLGLALEQVELSTEREQARLQAEALSEERRQRQELLQQQLLELLTDIEGAASGDLTVRADVSVGEIGTVADFFNSIVESLRQIVTQVKTSASRVHRSLGDNEVAIRTLAEDALKQAAQTTQTLDSVESMTQAIAKVAEQAQQAAVVAKTASETAGVGESAMDLTVQNILGLRETVGQTAKKVKRLGESSQQISKVVSLINQIAMQTNLLAINAGIEAARAGEEGQGFAAVAEEVGELAARSSAATQEIERIVDNIQRETGDVVAAIEESTAQVVEGTHRVEDAKQSLVKILEVSQQIDSLVQTISEATVSQVETSTTVSALMQQIASVSERTSDSSLQVSEALRQTVEVAEELQTSMAAFKVDDQG
jgi:twitching motility protein PilJ